MLHVIRLMFVLIGGAVGYWGSPELWDIQPWQGLVTGLGGAIALILLEMAFTRKFVGVISVLMFGVLVGFIVSHLFVSAVYLAIHLEPDQQRALEFGATLVFTFISVITILHAKDDFKFVVPFVEFSRQGKFGASLVLDTSTIIDGRFQDMIRAAPSLFSTPCCSSMSMADRRG